MRKTKSKRAKNNAAIWAQIRDIQLDGSIKKRRKPAKKRKATATSKRNKLVHIRNIGTAKGQRRVKVRKGTDGRDHIVAKWVLNPRTKRRHWKQINSRWNPATGGMKRKRSKK